MHLKNISYEEMKTLNKGIKGPRECQTRMIFDSFINSDKYAMQIILDDEQDQEAIKRYLEGKDGRTMKSYIYAVYTAYKNYIKRHKDEYRDKIKVCKKNNKIYLLRIDKTLTVGDQVQRRGYK